MSSKAARLAKGVIHRAPLIDSDKLTFPADMYTNIYGSAVICAYMFSSDKPDADAITDKWMDLKEDESLVDWVYEGDREAFFKKTVEHFGLKVPERCPVALVESRLNAIFAPYVEGRVFPIREDGFMTLTLRKGKPTALHFPEVKHD